jgi:hypothetical protein
LLALISEGIHNALFALFIGSGIKIKSDVCHIEGRLLLKLLIG